MVARFHAEDERLGVDNEFEKFNYSVKLLQDKIKLIEQIENQATFIDFSSLKSCFMEQQKNLKNISELDKSIVQKYDRFKELNNALFHHQLVYDNVEQVTGFFQKQYANTWP
ncbi:unnamed protein product [Schistosoma turkestanicum]|nr:unnamed protein product [Schistosoma turkestanicum]